MLGKNIKRLREKLGISQEELAHKMGMHSNTIARWERDEVDPRGTSMWKLANALNVSPETLLTGEQNIPDSQMNQDIFGMHGITFSHMSSNETMLTTQQRDEALQNQLINENKLNPDSLENYNGRTFYAGRSGHLYSPAPFRGISFWGEVLDAADFIAERADVRELSLIEPLLHSAYQTILDALNKKKGSASNNNKNKAKNSTQLNIQQTNIRRDANLTIQGNNNSDNKLGTINN